MVPSRSPLDQSHLRRAGGEFRRRWRRGRLRFNARARDPAGERLDERQPLGLAEPHLDSRLGVPDREPDAFGSDAPMRP
jgi:hypothetical protein